MDQAIQFGTDGWRAVIGDLFTLQNLERVTQATALALEHQPGDRVLVGHDRRFMAAAHAERVAEVLAGNGLEVLCSDGDLPTPALSGLVVDHRARAGIMLTASHNPPAFGGYKIKLHYGGSAPGTFTRRVERALDRAPVRRVPFQGPLISFRHAYFRRLAARLDRDRLQAGPPLTIVVDSMHGSGGDLLARFLEDTPHRVITLRGDRDVLFGGGAPEPIPSRLDDLSRQVVALSADLGLATDGDADRLVAVDEKGRFLSALLVTPLLADHLIRERRETGDLGRTTANSILLDRIAAAHGRCLHVRPIGFKNLVPLFRQGKLLIGGEESGGLGVGNYLPERDGLLIGLLLLEARVVAGHPLSTMVADLQERHGRLFYRRADFPLAVGRGTDAVRRLADRPPAQVAGMEVTAVDRADGVRLTLGDDAWVLVRCSGTEPVLRIYSEGPTSDRVNAVLDAVRVDLEA